MVYKAVRAQYSSGQGVIKPLFCVLEVELLSASDELLRETGQPHHVVRSHNELNVAKVASCVSMLFNFLPAALHKAQTAGI